MGASRNGARTFLFVMQKACHLSHLAGWRSGMAAILGADAAASFFALWDPVCALVDILIASDDWFNRKDATFPDLTGGEDVVPV